MPLLDFKRLSPGIIWGFVSTMCLFYAEENYEVIKLNLANREDGAMFQALAIVIATFFMLSMIVMPILALFIKSLRKLWWIVFGGLVGMGGAGGLCLVASWVWGFPEWCASRL